MTKIVQIKPQKSTNKITNHHSHPTTVTVCKASLAQTKKLVKKENRVIPEQLLTTRTTSP